MGGPAGTPGAGTTAGTGASCRAGLSGALRHDRQDRTAEAAGRPQEPGPSHGSGVRGPEAQAPRFLTGVTRTLINAYRPRLLHRRRQQLEPLHVGACGQRRQRPRRALGGRLRHRLDRGRPGPVPLDRQGGASWSKVSGLGAGAVVVADRSSVRTFSLPANGTLYAGTDGGATFTARATGLRARLRRHQRTRPPVRRPVLTRRTGGAAATVARGPAVPTGSAWPSVARRCQLRRHECRLSARRIPRRAPGVRPPARAPPQSSQ